jgi:tripartite ATP-independent transporter DctM subunit
MEMSTLGTVGVAMIMLLIFLRVPISIAMGGVGFVGLILAVGWPAGGELDLERGWNAAISVLALEPFSFVASFTLVAIPMFIMMGFVAFHAGFTRDLYMTARMWLGRAPGGLAQASVAGCAMFSAVSGSSMATAAAMGKLAVPEMLRYGYNKGLATGAVAAGGTLGALIPPSILMVLYGIFTEQSISKLLIAGLVPGLLSAGAYMLMIGVRASINPSLAPKPEPVSWSARFGSLRGTWSMIVLFVMVMGGIYAGVVTPTEAAAVGAAGAWFLAWITRRLSKETARTSIVDTVAQCSSIFAVVLGAKIFVMFIGITGVASDLAEWSLMFDLSPLALFFVLSLIYVILGTFMDPLGIMLLTLPVVTPMIEQMGYDLIWFGVIMVKLLEIGLITPPVGLNVFVLKGVVGNSVSLSEMFKGITWFIVVDLLVLALLLIFPVISLWLPSHV